MGDGKRNLRRAEILPVISELESLVFSPVPVGNTVQYNSTNTNKPNNTIQKYPEGAFLRMSNASHYHLTSSLQDYVFSLSPVLHICVQHRQNPAVIVQQRQVTDTDSIAVYQVWTITAPCTKSQDASLKNRGSLHNTCSQVSGNIFPKLSIPCSISYSKPQAELLQKKCATILIFQ